VKNICFGICSVQYIRFASKTICYALVVLVVLDINYCDSVLLSFTWLVYRS